MCLSCTTLAPTIKNIQPTVLRMEHWVNNLPADSKWDLYQNDLILKEVEEIVPQFQALQRENIVIVFLMEDVDLHPLLMSS
jgi:hypothetical protein